MTVNREKPKKIYRFHLLIAFSLHYRFLPFAVDATSREEQENILLLIFKLKEK